MKKQKTTSTTTKKSNDREDVTVIIHSYSPQGIGRADTLHAEVGGGHEPIDYAIALSKQYQATSDRTVAMIALYRGKILPLLNHRISNEADMRRLMRKHEAQHLFTGGEVPNLIFVSADAL